MHRYFRILFITLGLSVIVPLHAAEPKGPDIQSLVKELKSGDKEVRREASYRLSQLGSQAREAVPALIEALDDNEFQVWFNSITALSRIGPGAAEALPALKKQLEQTAGGRSSNQNWYRIAFALGSIGPAALPVLEELLQNKDARVRAGAAKAITWIGPQAERSIDPLLKNIGDSSPDVRDATAEALGKIGPAAEPRLVSLLGDEQPLTRAGAALALDWGGMKEAVPQLLAALKSEQNDEARIQFIDTLSRLNCPGNELLPLVLPLLNSSSPSVQQSAANAIVLMEPPGTTSVPALIRHLETAESGPDQVQTVQLLGAIGPAAGTAVPELIKRHATADAPLQAAINDALVQISEPAVIPLIEEMHRHRDATDHWSVQVLQQIGSVAVPALMAAMESDDPDRRLGAIQVLGLVGEQAEPAIAPLQAIATNGPDKLRGAALVALASSGAPADTVVPLAQTALKQKNSDLRRQGALALARLGNSAEAALPVLVEALHDRDEELTIYVIQALASMGQEARPALEPMLQRFASAPAPVREELVIAFGQLGPYAGGSVQVMIEEFKKPDSPLQIEILESLGSLGDNAREAAPLIEAELKSEDPGHRKAALAALFQVIPETTGRLTMLEAALSDPDLGVRLLAIELLGTLGTDARPVGNKLYDLTEQPETMEAALTVLGGMRINSVPLLVRALGNSDPYVRVYAANRLGDLRDNAKDAVPALKELMQDGNEMVKRAARNALRDIERSR